MPRTKLTRGEYVVSGSAAHRFATGGILEGVTCSAEVPPTLTGCLHNWPPLPADPYSSPGKSRGQTPEGGAMLKRIFSLEPAAVGSAASAFYLAVAMIYRAFYAHTGVFEPDLVVAAVTLVWGLWTRVNVTPLGRPRDRHGRILTAADQTVRPYR